MGSINKRWLVCLRNCSRCRAGIKLRRVPQYRPRRDQHMEAASTIYLRHVSTRAPAQLNQDTDRKNGATAGPAVLFSNVLAMEMIVHKQKKPDSRVMAIIEWVWNRSDLTNERSTVKTQRSYHKRSVPLRHLLKCGRPLSKGAEEESRLQESFADGVGEANSRCRGARVYGV